MVLVFSSVVDDDSSDVEAVSDAVPDVELSDLAQEFIVRLKK